MNHILSAISPSRRTALEKLLEPVTLKQRQELEAPGRKLTHLYFLEKGVAAVLSVSRRDRVAVGLIGCEGATGTALMLGDERCSTATVMLTPGHGFRLSIEGLREAMEESQTAGLLLRYCLAFSIQAQHTALSNALTTIPQRVARWLLMADDRIEGGTIPLTQEVIAFLLGTRRPAVTTALNELQRAGLVQLDRGSITVLERAKLQENVGHFYGIPEQEFVRLVGTCWPPILSPEHASAGA